MSPSAIQTAPRIDLFTVGLVFESAKQIKIREMEKPILHNIDIICEEIEKSGFPISKNEALIKDIKTHDGYSDCEHVVSYDPDIPDMHGNTSTQYRLSLFRTNSDMGPGLVLCLTVYKIDACNADRQFITKELTDKGFETKEYVLTDYNHHIKSINLLDSKNTVSLAKEVIDLLASYRK